MSKFNSQDSTSIKTLAPFQANFFEFLLDKKSPPYHLLIAPPGSGKTHISIAIITEMIKRKLRHFIILCPTGTLMEFWHLALQNLAEDIPITLVRRSDFREIEAATPIGQNPWKEGVYILSLKAFKHEDVYTSIIKSPWDLILIDEAHEIYQDVSTIFSNLVREGQVRRLLLASAGVEIEIFSDIIESLTVTNWQTEFEAIFTNKRKADLIMKRVCSYQRSSEELKFFKTLKSAESILGIVYNSLIDQASSSIFAAEKLLTPLSNVPEPKNTEEDNFKNRIKELQKLIDEISFDPKIEALKGLLIKLRTEDSNVSVSIISQYLSTASYISNSLIDLDYIKYYIVDILPSDFRQKAFNRFRQEGGVLISDATTLIGYDLGFADVAIFYDLPQDKEKMEQIEGRFNRINRTKKCTFYTFLDQSGVMATEKERLSRYGYIEMR